MIIRGEKMKEREGKLGYVVEKVLKLLPLGLLLLSLCAFSFYLGSIFCSDKGKLLIQGDFLTNEVKLGSCMPTKYAKFEECNYTMHAITPCMDPQRWWKFDRHRMAFRERHCPPPSERLKCLVPPPKGYRSPIPWPLSRDECWYRNVPYNWINTQKANQRWMQREGDKFIFPGGGTTFPEGVGQYLDSMEELIPEMKNGTVRTALDTGCGVASWGGYLLDRGILTISLAPRDNHEAQVQFALERGIPAMLGILATQRLPYPANAFDMAHCSRCLIPWTDHGGVFLLEVDRVLRPGGFWVLSGPPVNYQQHWKGWASTEEKQKADFDSLQSLLDRMCYKLYSMKGDIAVWQKPLYSTCYNLQEEFTYPPLCDDSIDPDASWYVPMRPCIVKPKIQFRHIGVGQMAKWPDRLIEPPERVHLVSGGSDGNFKRDTKLWMGRVKYYKFLLPELGSNKIRNIMDMNTQYGGFAAALINDPVWVMNVVSSYAANSLGVIYDRGLIGTINDWCEAFSTYPRTYDLLHVDGLFTAESHRCEMKYVLLEMDRILRPAGYVIIRDFPSFIESVHALGEAMRWKCMENQTEMDDHGKERILICQKDIWKSSQIDTSDEEK
eukprot:c14801_g1_i3 orf=431-2257(+)